MIVASVVDKLYAPPMESLISAPWLAQRLEEPGLSILDASWHMPGGRSGAADFADAHIPRAQFFDIDALSADDPRPHMLPHADRFGAAMAALGVGRDDRIIVYDDSPLRSAVRAWFMLRHFGASQVAILDGGLGAWRAHGLPLASGAPAPARPATFAARADGAVIDKDALHALLGQIAIADARGAARFSGAEADPRPGVAAGHLPGSVNLPYAAFYTPDGYWRSIEEIAQLFAAAGIDPTAPFVATCGSGITANTILLAAHRLGGAQGRLYDGSWAEWGADPALPKATAG